MPLKRLEPCVRQPDRRRRAGLRQLVRERDPVVEALPGPQTFTLVVKCPARPQKRQREKIYCGKLRPLKRPGHLNSGRLKAAVPHRGLPWRPPLPPSAPGWSSRLAFRVAHGCSGFICPGRKPPFSPVKRPAPNTKAPYTTDLLWETLRVLNRPGRPPFTHHILIHCIEYILGGLLDKIQTCRFEPASRHGFRHGSMQTRVRARWTYCS